MVVFGSGTLASNVLSLPRWAREREEQMEYIAGRVAAFLEGRPLGSLLFSALLLSPSILPAQQPPQPPGPTRPVVTAVRVSGQIQVDGRLDEPDWARAVPVTSFTQVDPEEGQPVSEDTEARILFDDEAIYIGVRLHDRQEVSERLGRRDMNLLDSDWLGVVIDSYHDHRTAFSFDLNPAGVQRDAVKSMGAGGREQDDLSWDPVWEGRATKDEGGWTAEYRIPFSQLRFGEEEEPTWGIQLERVIGRRREYSVLSFTPKAEQGGIPTYGHLVGLRGVKPGQRLEVLPYVVTRAEHVDPGNNPFREDAEHFASGGVDLLYRISSDFALNATLNPDFGQVEVDPAVINLTVYETFFQEKRPFFIEGSEIFDFGRNTSGGQLFYSRRIGRRPQLPPPSYAADTPEATTILGAGKVTGKTTNGWSLGIMEAVTQEETARYLDGDGIPRSSVAEPLTNYFVGRIRKDGRDGQSSVGAMVTATNRKLGTDLLQATLRESGYAGGIDFRHEWANRSWVMRGSFVGSRVAGDPRSIVAVQRYGNHFFQRPDAEYLEVDSSATSMSGYSVGVGLAKQSGEHWRGDLALAATSPTFEVNDLGFQTRTDRRDVALNVSYLENQPGDFFRNYSATGVVRYEHNYSNQRILGIWALNARFLHLNWWSGVFNFQYHPTANDDRATRGGPLMERPSLWTAGGEFSSDPRKSITLGLGAGGGKDAYGGWNFAAGGSVGIKASSRWNLTLSPGIERAFTLAQYVGTVPDASATHTYGAHYLFAPLHQTTVAVETRLDFTFNPRLSFQLYAQPFISSGDFEDVTELATPKSYDFQPWGGEVGNRDFNYRSLRGTAVLRWEWRPGSTLYLAWQQARSDYAQGIGDFDWGRDRQALFRARPDNVFVLKMNYWLSP